MHACVRVRRVGFEPNQPTNKFINGWVALLTDLQEVGKHVWLFSLYAWITGYKVLSV